MLEGHGGKEEDCIWGKIRTEQLESFFSVTVSSLYHLDCSNLVYYVYKINRYSMTR